MKNTKKTLEVNSDGTMKYAVKAGVEKSTQSSHSIPVIKKIYSASTIQKAKMRIMGRFLRPLADMMNFLYRKPRSRFFGLNKVYNENFRNAIIGEHPKFKIDFSRVYISRGDLANPLFLTVSSPRGGRIAFYWTDNSGHGKSLANDNLFIAVYEPKSRKWTAALDAAERKDCRFELDIPEFQNKFVHAYVGFVSADLRWITTSLYAGMINVY